MATTYTTNYNLGKQENHADKFDMDVITDNADKIDAALTAKADKSTTYTKTEVDTALSGKQATLTTAQLDAVNSGITSADVTQIGVNKNNISITDITANFTAATGYTIQSGISSVYKQGKHVFGTLSVKIDSGNLPTTNTTIATNNTDKPNSATVMPCGCGIDAWSINSIGTCYYSQYSGEIKCSDTVSTNTCFNLQLNYVTF